MIGVSFKVENEYNNYLFKIFENINMDNLYWKVYWNDIFLYNDINSNIFPENIDIIKNSDFLEAIAKNKYYTSFFTSHAFVNKEKIKNIDNYKSFMESFCEIIINCWDVENYAIICKNEKILSEIIVNCKKNHFLDIKILTAENDLKYIENLISDE